MGGEVIYLNLEFFFYYIYVFLIRTFDYFIGLPGSTYVSSLKVATVSLNFVFLAALLVFVSRFVKARKKEDAIFLARFKEAVKPENRNLKSWQDILDHVDSENESQWSLALIDADKILDEALRNAGYDGESIGDRLKTAEAKGGLKTLQDAWDAHKVRNRIAHESGFVLTKREARRAVELYKKVFEELGYL